MDAMSERGIGTSVHFIPTHHQPYFQQLLGDGVRTDFPVATRSSNGSSPSPAPGAERLRRGPRLRCGARRGLAPAPATTRPEAEMAPDRPARHESGCPVSARRAGGRRGHAASPARVLVVGGAGFVGSVLVRDLLERGYAVSVLDAFMYGDDGLDAAVRQGPAARRTGRHPRRRERRARHARCRRRRPPRRSRRRPGVRTRRAGHPGHQPARDQDARLGRAGPRRRAVRLRVELQHLRCERRDPGRALAARAGLGLRPVEVRLRAAAA